MRLDLADRENEQSHDQPYYEPNHQENDGDWWDQEYLRSASDEHGCALHDGYANSNILEVADGANKHECGNTPNDIGADFVVLLLFNVGFNSRCFHFLGLLEEHKASTSSRKNEKHNTQVNDWSTGNSEDDHVNKANKECCCQ